MSADDFCCTCRTPVRDRKKVTMAFRKFGEGEIPSQFNPDLRSLTLDCYISEYLPRQQLHVPARFTGLTRAIGYEKPPANTINCCSVDLKLAQVFCKYMPSWNTTLLVTL